MTTTTETPLEVGAVFPEADNVLGDHEEANDEGTAASANSGDIVDPDDSKVAEKKIKKKKKKKKKKGAGDGEKVVMPTQALVDLSFPWTAANRPNVGRCAVASRAIKAGEVVVAEQAVAFIPRSQDRLAVCHSCCKTVSPPVSCFECRDCQYSVFCKDCKEEAMARHKSWCQISSTISEIAKSSDCDEDLLHFVLELALQRHPTGSGSRGTVVNGSWTEGTVKDGIIFPSYEDAMCLKTHSDKVTAGWKTSVRKGCQLLYDLAVKRNGSDTVNFSLDDLENLAALVNTNSHGMGAHGSGIHNTDVAVGIFPFVSMLNHSCRPNCCFASDGRVMYVRATQDIPKDAELCLSYINLYEPRGTRNMQLAATKHFLCRCQRCSEPFSSSIDRFLEEVVELGLFEDAANQLEPNLLAYNFNGRQLVKMYLQGCICTVRGCGGVVVKASSFHDNDSVSESSVSSSWQCDQCSRILEPNILEYSSKAGSLVDHPWLLVDKAERKLAEAMNVYRERRFKDARVLLEQYVAEFTGKLHPLNVLLFDSLTPLMNCCRALGDAAEGSRVCRNILNCMEKVLPGISLELASFYFCLGEMYLERSEASGSNAMIKRYRKLAQETFQHVRMIREICLGTPTLPG